MQTYKEGFDAHIKSKTFCRLTWCTDLLEKQAKAPGTADMAAIDEAEGKQGFSSLLDEASRLRCVLCNVLRPSDGKLLRCLHLMCLRCAGESVSRHGQLRCCVCGAVTRATTSTAGESSACGIRWLPDSAEFLYPGDQADDITSSLDERENAARGITFCEVCDEMDVECEATHQCVDCGGRPLCDDHAETHPKRRYSRGHEVVGLDLSGEMTAGKLPSVARCCAHPGQVLIAYCQSCSQSVCAQCLSSTAHHGHTMENLAAVAEKRRERVKESLQLDAFCREIGTVDEAGDGVQRQPLIMRSANHRLALIATFKSTLEDDAKQASVAVAERFDEIERRLKERRCEVEQQIEHELWSGLTLLEEDERKLRLLQHSYATAMEIKDRAERCGDYALTIPVLECVDRQLSHINSSFQEVTKNTQASFHISAQVESSERVESAIAASATVERAAPVDVAKFGIEPATTGLVGHKACLKMVIRRSTGEPVPADYPLDGFDFSVRSPSEKPVLLTTSQDTHKTGHCAVKMAFTPKEVGGHILGVRFQGKHREFPFHVDDVMRFDPRYTSERYILSNDNRTLALGDKADTTVGFSLTSAHFQEGIHAWKVQNSGDGLCEAGIWNYKQELSWAYTSKTSMGGFNLSLASSHTSMGGFHLSLAPGHTSQWRNGDVIGFTLDCDTGTLEYHHQRTGEKKTLKNVDCTLGCIPFVRIFSDGCQITLC